MLHRSVLLVLVVLLAVASPSLLRVHAVADPNTVIVQQYPTGSQLFGNLTAPAGCSAAKGTCIRIGLYRCADVTSVNCRVGAFNEQSEWYVRRMAQQGNQINGIPVQFVWANLTGTTAVPWSATRDWFLGKAAGNFSGDAKNYDVDLTYQPFVDFVILTPGSGWETTMPALEKLGIPSVASNSPFSGLYKCPAPNTNVTLASKYPCAKAGYNNRRFQYAHGIASAGEQYFQPWVGLMKLKKVQTIGVVYTTVALYPSVVAGIQTAALDLSLTVTHISKVQTTGLPAGVTSLQAETDAIAGVIAKLKQDEPQGLVLVTLNCRLWIAAFREHDYAPSSLVTTACADDATQLAAVGTDMTYVMGSAQWSPDMNGNDYLEDYDTAPWSLFPHQQGGKTINDSSPLQYQQVYREVTKDPSAVPGYAEAAVLVGLSMLEGAITLAAAAASASGTGSGVISHPDLVNEQLKLYYQSSYYGLISTNRWGMNQQKQLVINQRDGDNVLRIVSPSSSANMDIIYPMPIFSERVYTSVLLATPVEYIVIALMCVCMAFTLGLMGYLVKNRHNQVFQAAGLPFYLLMGLGCITAFGSVLTWGVENNQATCSARIWMWTLGFHMFVDPLLASSWRIARIFSQKLQTVKLTNKTVGLISLGLLTPQIIINIVWATVAPLTAEEVNGDILRPAHTSFTTCSSGDDGVLLAGITLGYSGLLLLAASYLAYRVRKAYRMFNDAKPIAMSLYIFTVTAAIILVIQIALNAQNVNAQKVLFGLRSIGILVAYQSSISLLYFRRILGAEAVSKYGGGGRVGGRPPHDSLSSDSSGKPTTATGTGHKASPPHTHTHGTDSAGKIMFNKEGHSGLGNGGASGNHSGAPRNVHVHIQPPIMNNYSGGVVSAQTDGGTGVANTPIGSAGPSPLQRPLGGAGGNKSLGFAAGSPASRGVPGSIGASQLALDNLSRTPSAFANRPPPIMQAQPIVQVPPAIPLPSPGELNMMEHGQLISLVQQFHAQNQVLRSGVRQQNLQSAAAARGEPWALAPSRNTSLPGTPDRSPRASQVQGGANDNTGRRPSAMAALNIGAGLGVPPVDHVASPSGAFSTTPVEMVALRPFQSTTSSSGNGASVGLGAGGSGNGVGGGAASSSLAEPTESNSAVSPLSGAGAGQPDSGSSNVTAANVALDEQK